MNHFFSGMGDVDVIGRPPEEYFYGYGPNGPPVYRYYRRKRPRRLPYAGGVLLGIAVTNTLIALLIIMLGMVCTGLGWAWLPSGCSWNNDQNWFCTGGTILNVKPNCAGGTAVWMGILSLITGIVGLAATTSPRNRGTATSYQVLSILMSVVLWVVVVSSAIYMALYANYLNASYNKRPSTWQDAWYKYMVGNVAVDALLIVTTFIYIVLAGVTGGLLCYNFDGCCPGSKYRRRVYAKRKVVYTTPFPNTYNPAVEVREFQRNGTEDKFVDLAVDETPPPRRRYYSDFQPPHTEYVRPRPRYYYERY